jgi:hypothetical protein
VVYASAIVAVGSASVLLWWYMNHAGLNAPMAPDVITLNTLRGAIPPAVFAVSIPIAFVDPALAKWFWIAIWPANIFLERRYGKQAYGA